MTLAVRLTEELMKQTKLSTLALFALSAALLNSAPALAQNGGAWQFRWQKGQTLSYRVEHTTFVSEMSSGSKVETSSKLKLVKRWQVVDVDASNVATLQLSLTSLRHEQTRPNGVVMLFDSADLARSDPELREQMGQLIGKTLASLKINGLGQVVAVTQGSANVFESEPPFIAVLPGQAVSVGQGWQRTYQVSLDPPVGTGEKFAAKQIYRLTSVDGGKATLALSTELQSQPESVADRVPLLQKQPQGQVVIDVSTGRLLSARLAIDKTLENHKGQGSNYRFQSQYTEELINP
jgi:hypothetical protein